ncbi:hypothetical protein OPV22_024507 [Ensete ventricosum]|uniref:Uncharacterized protein n=1 Tax=Ensete ventricosum TaxID=4639 RepID=A0AAV8QGY6_ENSVE|nr:hypothetical protein OPV22_024507 [Ensete ventricosum]
MMGRSSGSRILPPIARQGSVVVCRIPPLGVSLRWSEKECDICEKPLALDVPSAIVKATDLNLTRLFALVMCSNNFNMT